MNKIIPTLSLTAAFLMASLPNLTYAKTPVNSHKTTGSAQFAYITNDDTNAVLKCAINATTGELESCASTGVGSFANALGVGFNHNFAYVTNFFSKDTVSQCAVDEKGELSHCVETTGGFSLPAAIAFSNAHAYIANLGKTISRCSLGDSGQLINCARTGSGFANYSGIAFNNGFAYVSSTDNTLSQCAVNPTTGDFSNCKSLSGAYFVEPQGIAVNKGFLYVANSGDTTISQCKVDTAAGKLTCNDTGAGFNGPDGIVFADNGFAYIPNHEDSTVTQCTVDATTGALSECKHTAEGVDFKHPMQMSVN